MPARAVVSSEGSIPKLTQVVVAGVLFLVYDQYGGLMSLLPVGCKPPSVPHCGAGGSLQHRISLHYNPAGGGGY